MRFRDTSKTLRRFRDRAKIFRDPRFSKYHSKPLIIEPAFSHVAKTGSYIMVISTNLGYLGS